MGERRGGFDVQLVKTIERILAREDDQHEAAESLLRATQGYALEIIWADHGVDINDKMDLFQAVMFEFFLNVKAGKINARHDGEVVNYLKALTRHRCIDDVRKKIRNREDVMEVIEIEEQDDDPYPDIMLILMQRSATERSIYYRVKKGDKIPRIAVELSMDIQEVRRIFFEIAQQIERLWRGARGGMRLYSLGLTFFKTDETRIADHFKRVAHLRTTQAPEHIIQDLLKKIREIP